MLPDGLQSSVGRAGLEIRQQSHTFRGEGLGIVQGLGDRGPPGPTMSGCGQPLLGHSRGKNLFLRGCGTERMTKGFCLARLVAAAGAAAVCNPKRAARGALLHLHHGQASRKSIYIYVYHAYH